MNKAHSKIIAGGILCFLALNFSCAQTPAPASGNPANQIYGDLSLLVSKMNSEKVSEMVQNVDPLNCRSLEDLVKQGKGPHGRLSLKLETPLKSDLSRLTGVSPDQVWEGLLELNKIQGDIDIYENQIFSNNQIIGNESSIGDNAAVTTAEEEKMKEKEMDDDSKRVEKSNQGIQAQIDDLSELMDEIAAFVFSQVPETQRDNVLQVLKKYDRLYSRQKHAFGT